MTTIEWIRLVFEGLTAVGTVGAVVVSLWLALFPRWRPFDIKDIRVSLMRYSDGKPQEAKLLITIHNYQNVPMNILSLAITLRHRSSKSTSEQIFEFDRDYVIALSQQEMDIPLRQEWAIGTVKKANKITVSIKTSSGSKTIKFPKKYRNILGKSLEIDAGQV